MKTLITHLEVCQDCGLLKNGIIQGKLVYPEPWSPERTIVDCEIYNFAKKGRCPECQYKYEVRQ